MLEPEHKLVEKLSLQPLLPGYQKIECPACVTEVSAANLDLPGKVAKCGGCNAVFSIAQKLEELNTGQEVKQEYLRPEGIDLFHYRGGLDITVQQHLQGIDMAGLFLFPFLAMLFTLVYFIKDAPLVLPVVSILISLYFVYRAAYRKNDKTYLDVSDRMLHIKARPRNFKQDKSYSADEIDQLYIRNAIDGTGYFTLYMIVNGVEGQKHEKLLTVNTLSKAKYLEQEIERYLNITDRPVPEAQA